MKTSTPHQPVLLKPAVPSRYGLRLLALAGASVLGISNAVAQDTTVWSGEATTDWHHFLNWSIGVPDSTYNTTINLSTGNMPVISSADASSGKITVGASSGSNSSLTISNGRHLTTTTATNVVGGFIGDVAGSTGGVTVTGTNSRWTLAGNLAVANFGTGTLDINAGGRVNAAFSYIGSSGGSNGSLSVADAGSSFNVTQMIVGNNGTGNLSVANGGVVNVSGGGGSTLVYVGGFGSANGTINVSGANSAVNISGPMFLGYAGTSKGTVNINNGGKVSNTGGGVIGYNAGTQGKLTISGENSQWINGGQIQVGRVSKGELEVGEGASVSGTHLIVAFADGANGSVLQTGGTVDVANYVSFGNSAAVTSGTGKYRLENGTLQVGGTDGIRAPGGGTYSLELAGGTIRTRNTLLTSSMAASLIAGTTSAIDTAGIGTTLNGVISGDGSLSKKGLGTLTLSNQNLYTGQTLIEQGTVRVTHAQGLGVGAAVIQGGTLLVEANGGVANEVLYEAGFYRQSFGASASLAGALAMESRLADGVQTRAEIVAGTTTAASLLEGSFSATSTAGNDDIRQSDLFTLDAGETDAFVLRLAFDGESPDSLLGRFNISNNLFELATLANTGNNATEPQLNYQGSFDDFQFEYGSLLTDYMGAYGFYFDNGETYVWAVLENGGSFAAIPEPGTWLLLAAGGGILGFARRNRRRA